MQRTNGLTAVLVSLGCLVVLNVKCSVATNQIAVASNEISYIADFDKSCELGPALHIKRRNHEEKICLLGSFSTALEAVRKCENVRTN